MSITERFIKYTTFCTTSDENTGLTPSTPGQMVFAEALRDELIALGLVDGQTLAGQHGFVNGAPAADNDAVGRNALAGTDKDDIAEANFIHACLLKFIAALYHCRARLKAHELADGRTRFAGRDLLHVFAEEDKRQKHAVGGEIELEVAFSRQRDI